MVQEWSCKKGGLTMELLKSLILESLQSWVENDLDMLLGNHPELFAEGAVERVLDDLQDFINEHRSPF